MKQQIPHKLINNIEYKKCSKCLDYKLIIDFYKHKNTYDKLYPSCKKCKALVNKYIPKKIPNKLINGILHKLCLTCNYWKCELLFIPKSQKCIECKSNYNKNYYIKNKKSLNKNSSQYYQENKNIIFITHKKWTDNNKEYLSEYGKKYREINKNKLQIYDRNKHHKYKNNVNYRITKNMRRRVLDAIKGNPKLTTTLNLVGCDINTLKEHLEKLFLPNMTWDNYGKWHIDHIIPCASFDLSIQTEQQKCFHFTNLQPLWAHDNIKKGSKL